MRVSVVVPARNAEATLARSLEAIAAQDPGEPFEVAVVDDGSTDATVAVADVKRSTRAPEDGHPSRPQ